MSKYKLSEQAAKDQLDLVLDYYELEEDELPDERKVPFLLAYNKLISAIRKGRLEISYNDKLVIVQHLKKPVADIAELSYKEIDGNAKLSMRKKADTDEYGKVYALLGYLSSNGEGVIAELRGIDLSIAECLSLIFLAV